MFANTYFNIRNYLYKAITKLKTLKLTFQNILILKNVDTALDYFLMLHIVLSILYIIA